MIRSVALSTLLVAGLLGEVAAVGQATFTNPIIGRGADPSVAFVDGMYYSVSSGCAHNGTTPVICIRAAPSLVELGRVRPIPIWTAPFAGPNSHDVWAPEIEFLDGHWYIYYAADPDANPHHSLFALVPRDANKPLGEWVEAPTGAPGGGFALDWKSNWAIDPSVFRASDGNLYLLFACRQDNTDQNPGRYQSICMAQMTDPLHLATDTRTGKKVVELAYPTQAWETRGFPTQEGPFGFTHDGVDYILYSASFSGNPDQYAEGLLINRHPPQPMGVPDALMNPAAWVKEGPVFDGHHGAYGTASGVFVPSPDGTEWWHVYHGTDCIDNCVLVQNKTWADRSIRAQRAEWSATGDLVLGYPVDIADTDGHGRAVSLAPPSTNGSGVLNAPAWGPAFGDAAEGDAANGAVVGKWNSEGPGSIRLESADGDRLDRSFYQSNPNFQNYVVYTQARMASKGAAGAQPKYGVFGAYVDHENYFLATIEPGGCGGKDCFATEAMISGRAAGVSLCALPDGFDPTQSNRIALEVSGGTFVVLVNDVRLSGACQARHFRLDTGQAAANGSNGQAGVASQNTAVDFASFTVSYGVPVDSDKNSMIFAFRNAKSQMELEADCGECRDRKHTDAVPIAQRPAAAPYPLTSWPAQMWKLKEQGGAFTMANAMTNLCLEADPVTGTVMGRHCNGKPVQLWVLLPVPVRSGFVIQNQATQMVLDSASTERGAHVILSRRADIPRQEWELVIP